MATKTKNGKAVKAHIQYRNAAGKRVPGVTTILGVLNKPALVYWANKMGLAGIDTAKYVDDKADIGTLAHAMIFSHLRGEELDMSGYTPDQVDLAENSFLKYLDWEKEHDMKPVLFEAPFVSEKYQYGGMLDNYSMLDNNLTLLDYKTSKAIYDEMVFQLAGYKQLLEENGHKVEGVRILRIGRNDTEGFEEKAFYNLDEAWTIFHACLTIYKTKQQAGYK